MSQKAVGSREMGARVTAAGSALFWAFFFYGLIDLAVPIDQARVGPPWLSVWP